MATKSTKSNSNGKRAPKRAPRKAAPKPKVGKAGYALGIKRTEAEWDALVPSMVKRLNSGETMQDLRAELGRSKFIRDAFRRAGIQPVGAKRGLDKLNPKARKSTKVKFIIAQRERGEGWDGLEIKTGLTRTDLKRILTEAGRDDLANGRVQLRTKKADKVAS
jgi:hypothetical protein